ncbi:MAG: hypothetical protein IPM74_19025 [Crocinitomicaceae bacterium]|nr:hypothetical protein [Crocinitomicaceae bacterium]MBK8927936.1 hypothetical protein [Crocinitomicaceae bacterium]
MLKELIVWFTISFAIHALLYLIFIIPAYGYEEGTCVSIVCEWSYQALGILFFFGNLVADLMQPYGDGIVLFFVGIFLNMLLIFGVVKGIRYLRR